MEGFVPGVGEQICLSSLKPTLKNYPEGMSGCSLRSVLFDVVVSIDHPMEMSLGAWFVFIIDVCVLQNNNNNLTILSFTFCQPWLH